MNKITNKEVQIHFECVCGFNSVDSDTYPIRWKDLSKNGIVRKKDKKTGKIFLFLKQISEECHCQDNY